MASGKAFWSVEDRGAESQAGYLTRWRLPASTPLAILAGCAGPLSTLPPKPGLSQKGGSQPAAQWQL